jgi:hypothetical protein
VHREVLNRIVSQGQSAAADWPNSAEPATNNEPRLLHIFVDRIEADLTGNCAVRLRRRVFTPASTRPPRCTRKRSWPLASADQVMPRKFGYPMKIRIPTKLGFKNPKFVVELSVTNSYPGGFWEDYG